MSPMEEFRQHFSFVTPPVTHQVKWDAMFRGYVMVLPLVTPPGLARRSYVTARAAPPLFAAAVVRHMPA